MCISIDSVTQPTVGQGSKLNKSFITLSYSAVTPVLCGSIDQETQITAWGWLPSFFPQWNEKDLSAIVVLLEWNAFGRGNGSYFSKSSCVVMLSFQNEILGS